MNKSNAYSVVEFGHLVCGGGSDRLDSPSEAFLTELFWNSLRDLVDEDEGDFTKGVLYGAAPSKGRLQRLKVRNYVGVLATEHGTLEILPKLARERSDATTGELRDILKSMLAYVDDLPFRQIGQADQDTHASLFEWFIAAFLRRILALVRRGLRSSYETLEDNLPVLRGRLVMSRQLRINVADMSKLYVRFDEFTTNRPENRLILSALQKCWKNSRTQDNRRLAKELISAFSDIPVSADAAKDLKLWNLGRAANHYDGLKGWCTAILAPYSATPSKGKFSFDSFLFPAETLFERYVAQRLQEAVSADSAISMSTQNTDKSLFVTGGGPFQKRYDLIPDIVINRGADTLILDTKWKMYSNDEQQISQADLYQLFTYGRYWGKSDVGKTQVALIAPKTSTFRDITGPHIFTEGPRTLINALGNKVELWMLPYDLFEQYGSFCCSDHFSDASSLLH